MEQVGSVWRFLRGEEETRKLTTSIYWDSEDYFKTVVDEDMGEKGKEPENLAKINLKCQQCNQHGQHNKRCIHAFLWSRQPYEPLIRNENESTAQLNNKSTRDKNDGFPDTVQIIANRNNENTNTRNISSEKTNEKSRNSAKEEDNDYLYSSSKSSGKSSNGNTGKWQLWSKSGCFSWNSNRTKSGIFPTYLTLFLILIHQKGK